MNNQEISRRRYSSILIIVGIIVLLYPLVTEGYGYFAQLRLQSNWDQEVKKQEKEAITAERLQASRVGSQTVVSENAVLTQVLAGDKQTGNSQTAYKPVKIKIPKIGLEQIVVNGTGTEALKNGPGHYPSTPNPGDKGNVAIAGHRVTYTKPFNRLDELKPDDEITLESLKYIYVYKVNYSRVLDPNDISELKPVDKAVLTLTTCTPKYSATKRLDVRATLVRSTLRQKPTIFRRIIASIAPAPKVEKIPQSALKMAIYEAERDLKANPRDYQAHIRLGVANQAQHKYKAAEAHYNQAAELSPGSSLPHYQLALLFEQTKKRARETSELRKAVAINPKDEKAIFKLGRLLLDRKKYSEAIEILQKAAELSPLSADTHYFLALAFEKTGDSSAAISHFQTALKYVPDYPEAKLGLKRVMYPNEK